MDLKIRKSYCWVFTSYGVVFGCNIFDVSYHKMVLKSGYVHLFQRKSDFVILIIKNNNKTSSSPVFSPITNHTSILFQYKFILGVSAVVVTGCALIGNAGLVSLSQ